VEALLRKFREGGGRCDWTVVPGVGGVVGKFKATIGLGSVVDEAHDERAPGGG